MVRDGRRVVGISANPTGKTCGVGALVEDAPFYGEGRDAAVDSEVLGLREVVLLFDDWDVVLCGSWRWAPLVCQHVVDVPESEVVDAYALFHGGKVLQFGPCAGQGGEFGRGGHTHADSGSLQFNFVAALDEGGLYDVLHDFYAVLERVAIAVAGPDCGVQFLFGSPEEVELQADLFGVA